LSAHLFGRNGQLAFGDFAVVTGPLNVLIITLLVQALVAAAVLATAVIAPAIAVALRVPVSSVGIFVPT
jgi:hypothetical protein